MNDNAEQNSERGAYLGKLLAAHQDAVSMIAELRTLIEKLADDLAAEIEGHYQGMKDYPSMRARYDRDMASVTEARRMLEASKRFT